MERMTAELRAYGEEGRAGSGKDKVCVVCGLTSKRENRLSGEESTFDGKVRVRLLDVNEDGPRSLTGANFMEEVEGHANAPTGAED